MKTPPRFEPAPPILGSAWFHIPAPGENCVMLVSVKQAIGSDTVPFLDRLKAALTEWMLNTDSGREAWDWSLKGFNIGDLAFWYDRPDLVAVLSQHGLYELKVETLTVETPDDWQHDTIIVNTDQLEELPPLKLTKIRR